MGHGSWVICAFNENNDLPLLHKISSINQGFDLIRAYGGHMEGMCTLKTSSLSNMFDNFLSVLVRNKNAKWFAKVQ